MSSNSHPDECVGTLLVHQKDLQELSPHQTDKKKKIDENSSKDTTTKADGDDDGAAPTLMRRITKRVQEGLNAPLPNDEDPSTWCD